MSRYGTKKRNLPCPLGHHGRNKWERVLFNREAAKAAKSLCVLCVFAIYFRTKRGRMADTQETLSSEVRVRTGSAFDGRRVRDLGLPPGCIIVTLLRGNRESVPTADTLLERGDKITAVIAPTSIRSVVPILRQGCGLPHTRLGDATEQEGDDFTHKRD
ncbi:MAG: hypothetical protein AUJ92_03255 [Armatimonadetes bacterium CG2_30_59_28]|nr:MAG: hypothetical protein AUJ92_03255 [Armatimonadetes bacterium CG2_30_59_28]PIU65496.1 MAG: hypothetical protein COS85_08505 [Armatimonadetes bacterium CG07_land_8_20_14_0_80_59_28]